MDWKTKGHRITAVEEESAAWELGIEPGMYLVSVNGFPVEDVFDYRFRMADEECTVRIREENGEESESFEPVEDEATTQKLVDIFNTKMADEEKEDE